MPSLSLSTWTRLRGAGQSACSFRVIELADLLRLASVAPGGAYDIWRDSDGLIVGTVSAESPDDLAEARLRTTELFTTPHKEDRNVGDTESVVVFLIPPFAEPTSWSDTMPARLTIRFVLKGGPVKQDAVKLSPFQPLSVSLSGGGLRATLYQLGIFVFLAEQNRLKDIREIVSVSGGSILSAHFMKHWPKATSGTDGFREVAARLLRVTQSNIRDRVAIPWLWSRLFPWWWSSPSRGITGRLKAEYYRIFGSTTLGELRGDNRPNIAIVATDAIRQNRVAFTASEILQWPLAADRSGRYAKPSPIIAKGVELALAVTASSCFPPVFPRLHLTHEDLGCTFAEFKESLDLNDGGVVTNLGIEVLVALREADWAKEALILIADAERPQAVKPGGSPITDVDASAAALSEAAKELARSKFGKKGLPISFSDRADNPEGLSHRTETVLAGYRTDLDAPTWPEIHALMLHGAMIARRATDGYLTEVSPAAVKESIAAIIAKAGGPSDSQVPDEKSLKGCESRPKGPLVLSGIGMIITALIGLSFVVAAVVYLLVRFVF
jgi:predicted acylesterase/phospholipase RssA